MVTKLTEILSSEDKWRRPFPEGISIEDRFKCIQSRGDDGKIPLINAVYLSQPNCERRYMLNDALKIASRSKFINEWERVDGRTFSDVYNLCVEVEKRFPNMFVERAL